MALDPQTQLAVVQVDNTSYRVRLTLDPGADTVDVRERTEDGLSYTSVATLDTSNWEGGVVISSKTAGWTYVVIGYGSDGTILREHTITLEEIDLSQAETALDDAPTSLYTGSIKETVRFDPKFRSPDWIRIYGND